MSKFLFFVLVIVGVLWWSSASRRRMSGRHAPPPAPPASGTSSAAQEMVRCEHCGVHLPRGDALFDGTRPYCSETHRLAGPQGGARP